MQRLLVLLGISLLAVAASADEVPAPVGCVEVGASCVLDDGGSGVCGQARCYRRPPGPNKSITLTKLMRANTGEYDCLKCLSGPVTKPSAINRTWLAVSIAVAAAAVAGGYLLVRRRPAT